MLGTEFRHAAPHRLVLVVIVFELLQLGQQGVPAALGDADGEHDEEAVEAGFFDHDTVFGQILGDDGGGDAGFFEPSVKVQTRRDDRRLDRVEHVEARRHVTEGMPRLYAIRRLHSFGIGSLQNPVLGAFDAVFVQFVRSPDLGTTNRQGRTPHPPCAWRGGNRATPEGFLPPAHVRPVVPSLPPPHHSWR